MGVSATHLVPLRVHFHGARSEFYELVFEDVPEAKASDLQAGRRSGKLMLKVRVSRKSQNRIRKKNQTASAE